MVNSNKRGRALEYVICKSIEDYLTDKLKLEVSTTELLHRTYFRDKGYFDELDEATQKDFLACGNAFIEWLKIQEWISNASRFTLSRLTDFDAKSENPADIQLGIINKNDLLELKYFSIKHVHNALCHPRLPSLAQQCSITDKKIDSDYRKSYEKVWLDFYKKAKQAGTGIKTYKELEKKNPKIKEKFLYEPLQKNVITFLETHANNAKGAAAFFEYLVGKKDYIVIKNEKKFIEIKYFSNIKKPTRFKINYPFKSKTTYLIEFNNGWKISMRIHTASSRIEQNRKIFMTEKEDPICINLEEMIKIKKIKKN
jgi:hypothetical protein